MKLWELEKKRNELLNDLDYYTEFARPVKLSYLLEIGVNSIRDDDFDYLGDCIDDFNQEQLDTEVEFRLDEDGDGYTIAVLGNESSIEIKNKF